MPSTGWRRAPTRPIRPLPLIDGRGNSISGGAYDRQIGRKFFGASDPGPKVHTAKERVWQGLSVAVALIGPLWSGWLLLIKPSNAHTAKKEEQGEGALPAAGALAPLGAGMPAARPLARAGYVQKHKPRVEFQPWSAPAHDDRTVQSQPEPYYMASGTTEQDTTCTRVTEQGTKAKISIPTGRDDR